MSASTFEYKTVALPQTVQSKRRRGVSEADLVAETLGELIHVEAAEGWEYMRSDILAAGSGGGMFSKESKVTYYSVLIFRRVQEGVWPMEQAEMARGRPDSAPPSTPPRPPASSAPATERSPRPAEPAPAPEPQPQPVAKPLIGDPTSPLAQGGLLSTGGQFRASGGGSSIVKPRPAPRVAPRPPLGSAQD